MKRSQTVVRLQAGQAQELALWKRIVDETRRHYEPIYKRMNVMLGLENERGESFYNPMLRTVVDDLKAKGVARESEGAIAIFVEGFERRRRCSSIKSRWRLSSIGTLDLAAIRYRIAKTARQPGHLHARFAAGRSISRAGVRRGALRWLGRWRFSWNSPRSAPCSAKMRKPFKTRSGRHRQAAKTCSTKPKSGRGPSSREKNPDLPRIAALRDDRAIPSASTPREIRRPLKRSNQRLHLRLGKNAHVSRETRPSYLQYAYARNRIGIFRKTGGAGVNRLPTSLPSLDSPYRAIALAKHVAADAGDCQPWFRAELKAALSLHLPVRIVARKIQPRFTRIATFSKAKSRRGSSRLVLIDITRVEPLALGLELLGIEHPEQM